jgi:hypothetical protein
VAEADAAGQLHGVRPKLHRLLRHQLQPPGDAHHAFQIEPFGRAKDDDQAPILQREKQVARPQRPPDPRDRGRQNLGLARPTQPVADRLQRVELQHEAAGLPPPTRPKGPIQRRDHLVGDGRLGFSRQGPAHK